MTSFPINFINAIFSLLDKFDGGEISRFLTFFNEWQINECEWEIGK